MMTPQTTVTILKAGSAIVVGFGILTAFAAFPPTAEPTRLLADMIFWPPDGAETGAASETRLFSAITGGVLVGWGVLLWLLVTRVFPRDPETARFMILASVGTWFVVDGLGSFAAGAPINVVLNTGFLALFVLPLIRPVATADG